MNRIPTMMCVFTLLLLSSSKNAHAVFIILNSGEQIIGYLVEQSDQRVTVQEATPTGKGRARHILRGDITFLGLAAEPERLESLRGENPKEYRNYAEEVAAKAKRDPEAREIAIRLYLIAAYLDSEDLGKSSLLGMINLARSAAEEKNFRALAYLLDPEHDERVLKRPEPVAKPTEIDVGVKGKLKNAVIALRRGNPVAARNFSSDPAVRESFKQFSDTLTYAEFEAATRTGEMSPVLLQRLVTIELSLMDTSGVDDGLPRNSVDDDAPNWAEIIREGKLEPVPSLVLETITEFDPGQCNYRDGKWVKPE
jgi:hypothetical protein